MAKKRKLVNRTLRHSTQISEAHCGPAVLQMLLFNYGIDTTQENIVKAAGMEKKIYTYGTNIGDFAAATNVLAPTLHFWYKINAKFSDLERLLNKGYAVGVGWQGLFEEIEDEDDTYGHYSIVSHIDKEKDELIIVDPYKNFTNQNRIVSVETFINRWWDWNWVTNPKTKRRRLVKDERILFVITREDENLPKNLRMKRLKNQINLDV